jgi:CRISPR-associated protein (TIGR03984 family)
MPLRLEPVWLSYHAEDLAAGEVAAAILALWGEEDGWALGHADDGVLWGKVEQGRLIMAPATPLERETLLDLRLFNLEHELRIFRRGAALRACHVTQARGREEAVCYQAIEQRSYLLLGRPEQAPEGEFVTLLGPGGQRHTPPRLKGGAAPTKLLVRHYYEQEPDSGLLRESTQRYLELLSEEAR